MQVPEGFELVDYGVDAAVLIYGAGEAARVAETLGLRVMAELPLERLLDDEPDRSAQATVVQLDLDRGAETDRLLDRVAAGSTLRGDRFVLTMPVALVDVAMRVGGDDVALLVDPGPADLTAALAIACARRGRPRLDDVNRDSGAVRLTELSEELGRFARRLAALSESAPGGSAVAAPVLAFAAPPPAEPEARAIEDPTSAAAIRSLIRKRRLRDQHFGEALFADPAWDILLDLAAARKEGRAVAVSSLCIAAAVPPTTALRWIGRLEEEGLIERSADPRDGRRVFIALAAKAAAMMDGWLRAAARIG